MPDFQVVMVGMEKWYGQDVQPLSKELRTNWGLTHGHLKILKDATKTSVLATVKALDKPSTLLFYYSGHGSWDGETKQFYMCTESEWLKDSDLTSALKATGATQVLVIVDACHSGGYDVNKDDPLPPLETRLETLAQGSGFAVLAACRSGSVTPGSSPLTRALKKTFESAADKKAVIDPVGLKQQIQGEMQQATLVVGPEFSNFLLRPGLIVIASCPNRRCAFGEQVVQQLGLGTYHLTSFGLPCPKCNTAMRKESLRFHSCEYEVEHSYVIQGDSGEVDDIEIVEESSGKKHASSQPFWPLTRENGYRTLDVSCR